MGRANVKGECDIFVLSFKQSIKDSEAVTRRCSAKKGAFWNISENLKENTSARVSFLIKLQAFSEIFKKICFYRIAHVVPS